MDDLEQRDTLPPSLTEAALGYLKAAGPWMFFLGILSFVGCGLSLLGGMLVIFTGSFVTDGQWLPIGFLYIVMAIVSFFPARFLFLTGSKLRSLKTGNSGELLEAVFKNNASFWKFCGVLSIVGVLIGIAGIVVIISAIGNGA